VGQLVHQHQVGAAGDNGVDVELGERNASVQRRSWGYHFPVAKLRASLGSPVAFDPTDDNPLTAVPTAPALGQHGVCLADTGGDPQVRA
jgi:hypothetical protein